MIIAEKNYFLIGVLKGGFMFLADLVREIGFLWSWTSFQSQVVVPRQKSFWHCTADQRCRCAFK